MLTGMCLVYFSFPNQEFGQNNYLIYEIHSSKNGIVVT